MTDTSPDAVERLILRLEKPPYWFHGCDEEDHESDHAPTDAAATLRALSAAAARVEAAVRAGMEAAADECNKTAAEARQYGLPGLAIGACKCRDDIRALAADDAAVARIAKGIML